MRHSPVALRRGDRALGYAAIRIRLFVGCVFDRVVDHAAKAQSRRGGTHPGKAGLIVGALNALLIVMKGLPLAYSKDLQEDKEGTFDALYSLSLSLAAMTGMVAALTPDLERMKAAAGAGYATASDLADWLVRRRKLPFPRAHSLR